MKHEFLVAYDYGMGGLWAVVHAEPSADILAKYPEGAIIEKRPAWMTAEDYQQLRNRVLDVDEEPPSGIFTAVVADRRR